MQPKNKRGRPPSGGVGTPIQVRLKPKQLAALDTWIKHHLHQKLTRPEAIRRLMELGLKR